ncbi:hypothetical protein DL96DRAFT_1704344 [Flagelloscypha sp. PMI_526]|nr:hypothetical protein DL96DRAFT_1704344 [Flagelloscypha sp. PMI_526]
MHEVYRPNPKKWVCGCPSFVTSRFLVCKHLVLSVKCIPETSRFFQQVRRNRTTPFWKHPDLVPLDEEDDLESGEGGEREPMDSRNEDFELDENDKNERDAPLALPSVGSAFGDLAKQLRDFADALEYQKAFGDRRFLSQVERSFTGARKLMDKCTSKERRLNGRGTAPRTWEMGGAMFYQHRPSAQNL